MSRRPTTRLELALALLTLLAAVGSCGESVTQPIQFSHKKHAAQGIECATCHKYFRTQTFSGLPTVQDCLECHEEAQGKSAEEAKLRALAKAGQPLIWGRLFKVPPHVYYSHRRHVGVANLPCKGCHGTMGESASPPRRPTVAITMDFCLKCHKKSGADTDCVACHR